MSCETKIIAYIGSGGGGGEPGPANVLSIGTVTTGVPGSSALASITGDSPNQVLNLTIPRGNVGENGTDGKSAYQQAVDNGFEGTQDQWLTSLIGADGATGAEGNGIDTITIRYNQSASGTEAPGGSWVEDIPEVSSGNFLWTRIEVLDTDNNTSTFYTAVKSGTDGTDGRSIFTVTTDVENIDEVVGLKVGDYILNGGETTKTILGVAANVGDLILVETESSGSYAGSIGGVGDAISIGYDNSISNLTAINVQEAVDELAVFNSDLDPSLSTVAVGGLPISTIGDYNGRKINDIIVDLVAPTLNPNLVAPFSGLTSSPANGSIAEIGSTVTVTLNGTFNRGQINPQYSSASSFRSGLPNEYTWTGAIVSGAYPSTSLTNEQSASGHTVVSGANTWTVLTSYDAGTQPKNNKGGDYSTPLSAGSTSAASTTINGIYPYFWYKSNSFISASAMKTAIETGAATKVVASSTGTIIIDFNADAEYIAIAYPNASTTKTKWFVNALDNGDIPGGLVGSVSTQSVDSPTSLWSSQTYKIHSSPGLITQISPIEFRNS